MGQGMMENSFVFYRSFFEALKEVDNEIRLEVYDAINEYALFGQEPKLCGTASALFKLMRPQIDANRKKRENGKKGGSKSGANTKQTGSKEEANVKQSASKPEASAKQTGSKHQAKEKQSEANVNANANANVNANEGRMPGAEAPTRKAAISLLLKEKALYPVYQEDIDRWSGLYPAVDVMQELRKMVGWLDANPTKRKTSRGIARFITGWLSREQDKGAAVRHKDRPGDIDEREYAPGELDALVYDPIEEILRQQEAERDDTP